MSTKLTKQIASVVLSVTTVVWLMGVSFVPIARADHSTAHTIEQLLQQIATLTAQLNALQAASGGATGACTFTRDLTVGAKGDDVKCLQDYLTSTGHFTFSGGSTGTFGPITKAAVAAWQAANGVSPAAGYFGPRSQAKYSAVVVVTPPPVTPPVTPVTPPPPTPPGTGVSVSAGTHPATGGLHPDNAVRVPYTAVVFTASADGPVTINSLTVERRGPSTDATFSGVVLLDQDGVQVGLEKTLNSLHQAALTESFTIPAGQSKTYWIAANRTTGGTNGTQASFALVAVNTSAQVSGTLPIEGVTRTMNVGGLTIGTATVETGPSKSVATTTEEVGKTMVLTAIKVSAGSTEDIELKSVRFNQVGTIGSADITDVQVKVGGTVYPHTVSTDGKYYTAKFTTGGTGVTITKGNNMEVTLSGTLTGGTNRTIKFDVYRMTDIAVNGKLYGYGINPTVGTGFTTTNPVYFASQVTVGKATLLVEKDPAVTAQNVAINLADQPIAGFIVDVKGEPISVASSVFRVNRVTQATGASSRTAANFDQVKLINSATGNILAGPVDGSGTTVTFSDTIVYPVGKTRIKLVGKLDTNWVNNEAVSASTTPGTNWTTVTGQNTGETITPTPSSAISGNNMTVKGAAVTISVAATPIAQTVVSGVQQFWFATYQLDATQSGEDIRFVSIPLEINDFKATATNLTSCQLYDGATSLTTSSNVVNPTASASSTVFTFDGSGLVIPKGTLKTLALKCNIAGGGTGSYSWGYDSSSSPSATGLTSGQSATITENDNPGQRMTLAAGGSYTVVDDSTPGYRIVNAGATGVTLLRLRFAAQDEAIAIERVGFQLSGVASNTPINLANNRVMLYDEAAPTVAIGTAEFTANGDFATSSLLGTSFVVPQGGAKTLIVKGDIATITSSGPLTQLTQSGDLLKVDYDGTAQGVNGGNYGTGQSSGTIIEPTSADTAVGGVRIMKAYPQFAKLSVPGNVISTSADNQHPLYRFSVTAVGGDVHLSKLTFNVSSTTISGNTLGTNATTSKYTLTAYTDSGFTLGDTTAPGNASGAGVVNGGQCYLSSLGLNPTTWGTNGSGLGLGNDTDDIEIFPTSTCLAGTTTYKVPAGVTRYFEFRANITNVETTSNAQNTFTVRLRGDAAFPTAPQTTGVGSNASGEMRQSGITTGFPSTTAGVDGDTNDDFIWSPASTSTSPTVFDLDFSNGYQVPGLPATDMGAETFNTPN